VIDDSITIGEQLMSATSDYEVERIFNNGSEKETKIYAEIIAEYLAIHDVQARLDAFDLVPVDVSSLRAYIYWLNVKSVAFKPEEIAEQTKQAVEILRLATTTGGVFLQRKKRSYFGRMYYTGTSIQNVNKQLRSAILGDTWELDLRSSVIAFKLCVAQSLIDDHGLGLRVRQLFNSSYAYVEERNFFIKMLLVEIFDNDCELSHEKQIEITKEAFTAIGFGARAKTSGWRLSNGNWKYPALKTIFKNPTWYENFIAIAEVKNFISEQEILDDYFFELVQKTNPEVLDYPELKSGKKLSSAKLMAFIYQNCETQIMDFVRKKLTEIGKPAIASIHDAVVIKKQLVNGQLFELNDALRRQFGNELLTLRQREIRGYKRQRIDEDGNFDLRLNRDELMEFLKRSFPEGNVPCNFNFQSCLRE
jgi:hypothetical protein